VKGIKWSKADNIEAAEVDSEIALKEILPESIDIPGLRKIVKKLLAKGSHAGPP
jgi:hypothetical protein